MTKHLDEIDLKILNEIQNDGRITNVEGQPLVGSARLERIVSGVPVSSARRASARTFSRHCCSEMSRPSWVNFTETVLPRCLSAIPFSTLR